MSSIRQRLTLTLLPAFALLLVLSGLAIYFFTRAALLNEFDTGLRARIANVMSLTEQGKDGLQAEMPDRLIPESHNDLGSVFYEVWQTNGLACARSGSLKGTDLPRRFGSPAQPLIWNFGLPGGGTGRAIGLKFLPKTEDEEAGHFVPMEAIVVVAADRQPLDRTLAVLATVLVVTGLLAIAITVPMIGFSLRRGHVPLAELARQAAAITADSLQTRFPVAAMPAELQPITQRLNDLLGRLEASFERERRFSADLAHELRTPLAELRTHAEVELEWAKGDEAEKHRETLNIALQMEAMVTRLLELARSENGRVTPQLEPVLIAPLVAEVWRPLAVKAKTKQLAVQVDISPAASLQTDRVLFRSIVANLLSNAVEYAAENGRVEISWLDDAGELKVSNPVHDLNPEDVPHLFERLWRKDQSRTGTEHCGLGLALSREFAALLGLNLTASFSNLETLTLSLKKQPDSIAAGK